MTTYDSAITFTSSAVTHATTTKAYTDPVEIDVDSAGVFRVVFAVSDVTLTTTTQAFIFGVEADVDTTFTAPVAQSLPAVRAAGEHVLILSGSQLRGIRGASVKALRAFVDPADVAGASVTFTAFIAPASRA